MDNRAAAGIKLTGKTGSMIGFSSSYSFLAFVLFNMVLAEVTTAFFDPGYGLFYHFAVLMSLLILGAKYMEKPLSDFFLSLTLAPLIRVISLSLPLTYFPRYLWYLVTSIPIFAATLMLMRLQGIDFSEAGVTVKRPLTQYAIAFTGIPFGVVEYFILKPEPIAAGLTAGDLNLLAVSLMFSTGFVEELAFRGVMQLNAMKVLRENAGMVCVAAVFASLHISWLSMFEVLFVFCVGLFYGFLALKTGSILGVSLSHGLINVYLFLVAPSIKLINV